MALDLERTTSNYLEYRLILHLKSVLSALSLVWFTWKEKDFSIIVGPRVCWGDAGSPSTPPTTNCRLIQPISSSSRGIYRKTWCRSSPSLARSRSPCRRRSTKAKQWAISHGTLVCLLKDKEPCKDLTGQR